MNIITDIKVSYDPREIDPKKVIELFMKNRKRKGELTPKEVEHLNNVLALADLINTYLLTDHILHLSDDKELGEAIGCSEHSAKRAKNKLRILGFIFVPDYARQKKVGDHPIWLAWFALTNKIEELKVSNKNKKPRKKNFVAQYYTFFNKAKKNVREWFEEYEKETGETITLHIGHFMAIVHAELTIILEVNGLTRADLRI